MHPLPRPPLATAAGPPQNPPLRREVQRDSLPPDSLVPSHPALRQELAADQLREGLGAPWEVMPLWVGVHGSASVGGDYGARLVQYDEGGDATDAKLGAKRGFSVSAFGRFGGVMGWVG